MNTLSEILQQSAWPFYQNTDNSFTNPIAYKRIKSISLNFIYFRPKQITTKYALRYH